MTLFTCDRAFKRYRDFTLSVGDLYGRDDKSPYVWQGEYAKEGKVGLHATLRLFRLDMGNDFAQGKFAARGWYEVWETSHTTIALIWQANAIHMRKRHAVQRWGFPNRCAEVPVTHKHHTVFR
jgi:hypothetical protein